MNAVLFTERKPPINHLFVRNETCLHWRAEKYEEDTEVYKVTACDHVFTLLTVIIWHIHNFLL